MRVELWSAIDGSRHELARMHIVNAGGSEQVADYQVRTLRGRSTADLNKLITTRDGRVDRHPRLREHVWHLVAKALSAMKYGATAHG